MIIPILIALDMCEEAEKRLDRVSSENEKEKKLDD